MSERVAYAMAVFANPALRKPWWQFIGWTAKPWYVSDTANEWIAAHAEPIPETGCWIWQRRVNRQLGYGYTGDGRRAHIVAWELACGPVLAGLELDHLCGVKLCIWPPHLEPVTHSVNLRRGHARIQGRLVHEFVHRSGSFDPGPPGETHA